MGRFVVKGSLIIGLDVPQEFEAENWREAQQIARSIIFDDGTPPEDYNLDLEELPEIKSARELDLKENGVPFV